MRFHFAPLSSTLSDLDPGHTGFQWPIFRNLFKITTELLLMMDKEVI